MVAQPVSVILPVVNCRNTTFYSTPSDGSVRLATLHEAAAYIRRYGSYPPRPRPLRHAGSACGRRKPHCARSPGTLSCAGGEARFRARGRAGDRGDVGARFLTGGGSGGSGHDGRHWGRGDRGWGRGSLAGSRPTRHATSCWAASPASRASRRVDRSRRGTRLPPRARPSPCSPGPLEPCRRSTTSRT